MMKRVISQLLVFMFCLDVMGVASRIKDITEFQGVRDNILIGYGLVVGLNGTGDDVSSSPYTKVSLASMLERLGVNVPPAAIKTKSVAAVMVTATLPPFARNGMRIDVSASTIGNAKSLQGGVLLATPLMGADGQVYAVAQGSLAVGGFTTSGKNEKITKGVPTNGKIANGGTIEREVPYAFNDLASINLTLTNPDFTTARRVAEAINRKLLLPAAFPADSTTVQVQVPSNYKGRMVDFLTMIEQLPVEPDASAIVVIDEQSGIIVIGDGVHINPVAIAQGNLIVEVQETDTISQPTGVLSGGTTAVATETAIRVDENTEARMRLLRPGASLRDLVNGLNALGVGPRDLITILQVVKSAGALQSDLRIV